MRLGALCLITCAAPLAAQDFVLTQPIDCTIGQNCFIQQYVDHDPTTGASDFTCGPLVYDGHKGTDFRLLTMADMLEEVVVLAAAPGTVVALRSDMPDTGLSAQTEGRECGNGVVVRHAGGWETQYCHLMEGSIIVEKGAAVTAGQVIGLVGYSGNTQFPHLHLSVRRHGEIVDPFDPDGKITCGSLSEDQLFSPPIPYSPGAILTAGFSDGIPDFGAVQNGTAPEPATTDAAALVVWGYIFGGQKGDVVTLNYETPDGQTFERTVLLKKNQAQLMRASGKKRPPNGWAPGDYIGTVTLTRKGVVIDEMITTLSISR